MRDSHSPSSAALGARCPYAWALCYVDGIREPDVPWLSVEAGAECTSRQRAAALGKAGHATLGCWYGAKPEEEGAGKPGAPNWTWFPGRVVAAGTGYLPHPEQCRVKQVERPIGLRVGTRRDGEPLIALEVHGVRWSGVRDLLALPTMAESKRLGLPAGYVQIDYKTTSSIADWAKTADALRRDPQCCLYTLDALRAVGRGADAFPSRWLYFETKKVRRSLPVDVTVTRSEATVALEEPAALCKWLDQIERSSDAPRNPKACLDFGGCCGYHQERGGPCDARLTVAGLIRARPREDKPIMPVPPSLASKFAAAEANVAAPAAPRAGAKPRPPAPAAAARAAAAAAAEDEEAPAPGRPRAPAAPPPKPEPTGPADVQGILARQTELATAQANLDAALPVAEKARAEAEAAEAAVAEAQAAVDAAVEAIRGACGG